MKKTIVAFLLLVLVFIVWWQPFNLDRTEVTIPAGAHAREIAENLSRHHIVRDIDEFLFWLKISGKEKYLKSGTYELYKYKSPLYVICKLASGGKSDITVTIPEGLTIYETAEILGRQGITDKEKFVTLCHDKRFVSNLGLKGPTLEGYLFPDTYSFNTSQTDSEVIITFVKNSQKHIETFQLDNADSIYEIITIASLVEKEAKFEDERPVIAKVFMNRLEKRRPLESCATILYALKKGDNNKYQEKKRLTERDLQFDSPYNTYLHVGLPPGPICSPGASSIKAVISPADVDYLYFVSKGNGRHHFSRTYREHIVAKERYDAQK